MAMVHGQLEQRVQGEGASWRLVVQWSGKAESPFVLPSTGKPG